MDDEWVKKIQAKAMADLKRDLAEAEARAKKDPVKTERKVFIVELVGLRWKKKLSQAELAARLGTGQSAISRIEGGKGNPSLNTLLKITKALDAHLVLK